MAKDYKKKIADMRLEAGKLMTEDQITKCNIAIHAAAVAAGGAGFIPIPASISSEETAAATAMCVAASLSYPSI